MSGMALGAPAEVNDDIVVPDHGERLDHLGRVLRWRGDADAAYPESACA